MNLSAYDITEVNVTDTSYIDAKTKMLYSKNLVYYPYYAFLHRYNSTDKTNDYYLALLENVPENIEGRTVIRTKKNTIKINLAPIWNNSSLRHIKGKVPVNIEVIKEEHDGIIYALNI